MLKRMLFLLAILAVFVSVDANAAVGSANPLCEANQHTLSYYCPATASNTLQDTELGKETVSYGTKVTVQDIANNTDWTLACRMSDYRFDGWDYNDSGTVYAANSTFNMPDEDVTLTAHFVPSDTVSIYYHPNDGVIDNEIEYNKTCTQESSSISMPNDPTRTGYKFAGWNTDPDGKGDTVTKIDPSMCIQDIHLYAQWTANTIRVIFNANGASGTNVAGREFEYGTQNYAPGAGSLTKKNHVFLGWAKNEDATSAEYVQGATIKNINTGGEITLYAVWSPCAEAIKGSNVASAELVGVAGNVCQYKHVCNVGYYNANHNMQISSATMSCAACTGLPDNAKWTDAATTDACAWDCEPCSKGENAASCTVAKGANTCTYSGTCKENTFNLTASDKTVSCTACPANSTAAAENNATSCTCIPNYSVGGTTSGATTTSLTECLPIKYDIKYELGDDGTNYTNAPSKYTYGTGVTINGVPTKSGYVFGGWCDADQKNCAYERVISATATGTQTLYAKWTEAVCNAINATATPSVANNTVTCAVECKSGYSKTGAGDTTTKFDVVGDKNVASVDVECKIATHTITVKKNDGSGTLKIGDKTATGTSELVLTCEHDTTVTLPAWDGTTNNTLTKSNSVFNGWDSASVTCDEDKTVTATWTTCGTCSKGTGVESCTVSVKNNVCVASVTSCQSGYNPDKAQCDDKLSCTCDANGFKVVYNGNGNTGGSAPTSPTSCTYAGTCNAPTNTFIKTGKEFTGWNTKLDGTGTSYAAGASISEAVASGTVTLYAQWKDCTAGKYCPSDKVGAQSCPAGTSAAGSDAATDCYFTVTLNKKSGSGTCGGASGTNNGSVTCYYNTACTLPSWNSSTCNITNGANVFKGWSTASTPTSGSTSLTFTSAATVYAYWVAPTCSATNGDASLSSVTDNKPECSITCKTGYSQGGGTDSTKTFTVKGSAGATSASGTCSAITYTVSYAKSPDAATGTVPSSHTCTYDGTCTAAKNPFSLTGYSFNNWSCSASSGLCASSTYASGGSLKNATSVAGAKVTLTAQWTANTYTVTLRDYADSTTHSTIYQKYATGWYSNSGASTALSKATVPTRSGYKFRGFYTAKQSDLTASGGSGTRRITNDGTLPGNTTFSANTNLYAAWAKDCTKPSNGTCSLTINSDGTATYTASCNTGYTVSGATTATPVCQENTYTVTYNANGGSGTTASSTHTYDTAKTLTTNAFTRTGYTFAGWNTEADGSGTSYSDGASVTNLTSTFDGTVTLYAQWTACGACSGNTGANCTMSVVNNVCTYTTTCKGGYYNITNNGKYNASCSVVGDGWYSADKSNDRTQCTTTDGWTTATGTTTASAYTSCYQTQTPTNCSSGTIKRTASSISGTTITYGSASVTSALSAKANYYVNGATCSACPGGYPTSAGGAIDNTYCYTTCASKTGYALTSGVDYNGAADTCKYTANKYTVVFNKNAEMATGTMLNQEFTYDTAQDLASNTFKYEGLNFQGWATSTNGAVVYTDGQNVKNLATSGVYNLYAVWGDADTYTITYMNVDGATHNNAKQYTINDTITFTDASKVGYKFDGWYKESTFTTKVSGIVAGTTGNQTFYAKWTANTYNCSAGTYLKAGATTCTECPANSFCVGDTYTFDTTKDQGIEGCPTAYPNSDAGANNAKTKCYSNIKQRAWTGNQLDGEIPASCSAVTEWNACSIAACEYVAYSNAAGTGDGDIKYGCATNADNCTKTAKSVTANPGAYVWGKKCYPCSDETYSLGGTPSTCTSCTGCTVCDATNGNCSSCYPGYGLSGEKCKPCTGNTYSTGGANACDTCNAGYTANSGHTACEANEYTVTYACGEGTGTAPGTATATYDANFTPTANTCTRDGYTFGGWKVSGTDDVKTTAFKWTYTEDKTFTAKWVVKGMNTISFKVDGGSLVNNTKCNAESSDITLPTTTRTGYTFDGWYNDVTKEKTTVIKSGTCTSGMSFTAKWTANTYAVTYDCGTGTLVSGADNVQNVAYDDTFTTRPASICVREGYVLARWNGAEYTKADTTYTYKTAGNVTLTAQWTANTYECEPGTYLVAGATTCTQCPANSFCVGGTYTFDTTKDQGIEGCPTAYPNSDAGANNAKTKCYSNIKQRAWTGNQVDGTVPTNCASVTEWNACSIAACEYVAYSNAAGTGDGDIKYGCETNADNCTKTAKSVTAKANYYVNGAACSACPSGYPMSDGGNITSNKCYGTFTKTGKQVNGSVPTNCASVETWNTCNPGTCEYTMYADKTVKTDCTPTDCTKTVKSVTANPGAYVDGTTCSACPSGYPMSDGGNITSNKCYATFTKTGKQVNGSVPTNCASVETWNTCNPGTCEYTMYADKTVKTDCTPTDCTKTAKSVTAKANYYVNGATCSACPSGYPTSAGGASGVDQCYMTCESYDIVGGTAHPVSTKAYHNTTCEYYAVSDNGNTCKIEIVNGMQTCIEVSCKYDYEFVNGTCHPCDRDNATAYKPDGNCQVAQCELGYHPVADQCVMDVQECSLPNASEATKVWDAELGRFGECVATSCEDNHHLDSGTCVTSVETCDVEHGTGTREWDEKRGTWGDCIATTCDAGYTNDAYDSAEPNAQCGRCRNATSVLGEPAASSYVSGCEIASCMYQGELYKLENNECVPICPIDPYEDETGVMYWNKDTKKCERKCFDGYMSW